MTKDELVKLAERVEAADASEQRAILIEVWRQIEGGICPELDAGNHLHPRYRQFADFIQVGAFTDAAMMLVPPAYRLTSLAEYDTSMGEQLAGRWTVGLVPREHSHLKTYEQRVSAMGRAEAATPALALCAASLRATTTGEAK